MATPRQAGGQRINIQEMPIREYCLNSAASRPNVITRNEDRRSGVSRESRDQEIYLTKKNARHINAGRYVMRYEVCIATGPRRIALARWLPLSGEDQIVDHCVDGGAVNGQPVAIAEIER